MSQHTYIRYTQPQFQNTHHNVCASRTLAHIPGTYNQQVKNDHHSFWHIQNAIPYIRSIQPHFQTTHQSFSVSRTLAHMSDTHNQQSRMPIPVFYVSRTLHKTHRIFSVSRMLAHKSGTPNHSSRTPITNIVFHKHMPGPEVGVHNLMWRGSHPLILFWLRKYNLHVRQLLNYAISVMD